VCETVLCSLLGWVAGQGCYPFLPGEVGRLALLFLYELQPVSVPNAMHSVRLGCNCGTPDQAHCRLSVLLSGGAKREYFGRCYSGDKSCKGEVTGSH